MDLMEFRVCLADGFGSFMPKRMLFMETLWLLGLTYEVLLAPPLYYEFFWSLTDIRSSIFILMLGLVAFAWVTLTATYLAMNFFSWMIDFLP